MLLHISASGIPECLGPCILSEIVSEPSGTMKYPVTSASWKLAPQAIWGSILGSPCISSPPSVTLVQTLPAVLYICPPVTGGPAPPPPPAGGCVGNIGKVVVGGGAPPPPAGGPGNFNCGAS